MERQLCRGFESAHGLLTFPLDVKQLSCTVFHRLPWTVTPVFNDDIDVMQKRWQV
jgi:hypothetical protein